MRRPVASLLLVLLLAGFALPLLQAQPDVHACCRRNGMHHCSAPATADGFHSTAGCCPYRQFRAVTTHPNWAIVTAGRTLFHVLIVPHSLTATPDPDFQRFARNNSQRGPPLS